MRRLELMFLFFCFALCTGVAEAAEARILKVLPQYVDKKGRHTLSPSLYERDAYQAQLRAHPEQRSAMVFEVQWKAKDIDPSQLKIRIDLRGVKGNALEHQTIEQPVGKSRWPGHWTTLKLEGAKFKEFGELIAWRATLWQGEQQLSEQKSFLW